LIFNSGYTRSAPYFFNWLLKNQGLGIVVPTYTPKGEQTALDKIINAPVLSNILGRWIKVSDYGRSEELKQVSGAVQQEKAKASLERNDAVDAAVKQFNSGDKSLQSRVEIQKKLVKDMVGSSTPAGDQAAEANRLIKKFNLQVLKGRGDANTDSLIYAVSNEEKTQLLLNIKKNMPRDEFVKFVNEMHQQKVIGDDVITGLKKLE
jgi:hypothetical protein